MAEPGEGGVHWDQDASRGKGEVFGLETSLPGGANRALRWPRCRAETSQGGPKKLSLSTSKVAFPGHAGEKRKRFGGDGGVA